MYLAEHALAAFRPGKVTRGSQRQVYERHRGRCLAQPAEAARRPHLVGDQVGHLVEVTAVDRGELFDLGHPIGMGHAWPGAVVEGVPRGGDGGVDVLGSGDLDVADRFFGVWGDHGELLRVGGFAPLAPDEELVIGTMAGILCHRGTSSGNGTATAISLLTLT